MRILDQFVGDERECSYLPDEIASLDYKVIVDVSPEEWARMLERGWRRFGVAYFRPSCPSCSECLPVRIPVDAFSPSKSQRRVLRNTEHIRLEIGPPLVDEERMELYRAWHDMQGSAREWTAETMTAERYFHEFAFPHASALEFAYYDGDRLIGVGLVDETPDALSAVYTYHHPDYRKASLETMSVLRQVEVARRAEKRWLYLGYRVMGCVSSEYKARFKPYVALQGWPEDDEPVTWREPTP